MNFIRTLSVFLIFHCLRRPFATEDLHPERSAVMWRCATRLHNKKSTGRIRCRDGEHTSNFAACSTRSVMAGVVGVDRDVPTFLLETKQSLQKESILASKSTFEHESSTEARQHTVEVRLPRTLTGGEKDALKALNQAWSGMDVQGVVSVSEYRQFHNAIAKAKGLNKEVIADTAEAEHKTVAKTPVEIACEVAALAHARSESGGDSKIEDISKEVSQTKEVPVVNSNMVAVIFRMHNFRIEGKRLNGVVELSVHSFSKLNDKSAILKSFKTDLWNFLKHTKGGCITHFKVLSSWMPVRVEREPLWVDTFFHPDVVNLYYAPLCLMASLGMPMSRKTGMQYASPLLLQSVERGFIDIDAWRRYALGMVRVRCFNKQPCRRPLISGADLGETTTNEARAFVRASIPPSRHSSKRYKRPRR